MSRLRACIALTLPITLLLTVSGCSSGDAGKASTKPTASYQLPGRPVRDGEQAVKAAPGRSGDTTFTVIGYRGGMSELVGSHADRAPKGQYVRIRIVVENIGRTNQTFDAKKHLLVTASGRTATPDLEAMLIKRQPEQFDLGAGVRVEMDLWYDVPRAEHPSAVRFVGAPGVGAVSDPPPASVKLPANG